MPDLIETLLFVAAFFAVAVGTAMIFVPAGLIVAGVMCASLLVVAKRGSA
jgi:hypothetical protein